MTQLASLVGTWEFEPTTEGGSPGHGTATFDWIEDRSFVVMRTEASWTDPGWVENAPRTTRSVLGHDDTTGELVQLYADSRGVSRIYRGSLTADAWRLERAAPEFHQRFIGEFRDGGRTIDGRWETSRDGTAWKLDFPIVYRRTDATTDR